MIFLGLIGGSILTAVFISRIIMRYFPAAREWKVAINSVLWLAAIFAAMPVYLSSYRKLKALGMILAELGITDAMGGERKTEVRAVVANVILVFGLLILAGFTFVLSYAVLPPPQVLYLLIALAAVLVYWMRGPFNKIYFQGKAALAETFSKNEPPEPAAPAVAQHVTHLLREARLETLVLAEGMPGAGRTPRDLELKTRTGAFIVGIEREALQIVNPEADELLLPEDQLLLVGSREQLDAAIHALAGDAVILSAPPPEPCRQRGRPDAPAGTSAADNGPDERHTIPGIAYFGNICPILRTNLMSGATPSHSIPDFEEINSPEFLEMLLAPGPAGQRAFTRMVQGTHEPFLGFIRRQLPAAEECQEVLQEVYLAVHKGLPRFEGKSKLTTWIFSLAHHKICDRIADRNRGHKELTASREAALSTESATYGESGKIGESAEAAGTGKWAGITAWDAAPDRLSARNAVEGLIGKAIEALPEAARRVYHLRDVEGLSGEEAAEALGMTPENVRVQLHRARKQIVEWVREKMAGVRKS